MNTAGSSKATLAPSRGPVAWELEVRELTRSAAGCSVFRFLFQPAKKLRITRSIALRLYPFSKRAINPSHYSCDRTFVPPFSGSRRNTWTALMLMVVPVQPMALGGSTICSVEVSEFG
jgi:hypothetical protein